MPESEELHLLDGELWIDDSKLYPGDYNRAEACTGDKRVWSETGCTCVLITSTLRRSSLTAKSRLSEPSTRSSPADSAPQKRAVLFANETGRILVADDSHDWSRGLALLQRHHGSSSALSAEISSAIAGPLLGERCPTARRMNSSVG